MKLFNKIICILILIFSFQSWTKADDIRDFQIEGMSIGDSALEYYTETQIKNNNPNYYKDKKYTATCIKYSLKVYDTLCLDFKTNDGEKKIQHLTGLQYMDIKKCNDKKNEVVIEISELMIEAKKREGGTRAHIYDKSGESTINSVDFEFNSGNYITIECHDWSEKLTKEKGWKDHLRISVKTKEFNQWLYVAF